MRAKDFLTGEEIKSVTQAIVKAEKGTSGEIRIHLDETCATSPLERAEEVFRYLKMDRTRLRNGVLIYVACQSKVFAIIGDKGINDVVPENFWQDISEMMKKEFASGRYASGLAEAVNMAGEKLKEFFPYQTDDVNELPDDISFGQQNP